MRPSDFWCASQETEQDEFESYGESRCMPVSSGGPSSFEDVNWKSVMTAGMLKRSLDFDEMRKTRIRRGQWGPTDTIMYDLDHNINSWKNITVEEETLTGRLSRLMCLTSHGFIMNSDLQRPLLAHEWLNVHGYPCRSDMDALYTLPVDFQ